MQRLTACSFWRCKGTTVFANSNGFPSVFRKLPHFFWRKSRRCARTHVKNAPHAVRIVQCGPCAQADNRRRGSGNVCPMRWSTLMLVYSPMPRQMPYILRICSVSGMPRKVAQMDVNPIKNPPIPPIERCYPLIGSKLSVGWSCIIPLWLYYDHPITLTQKRLMLLDNTMNYKRTGRKKGLTR